MITSYAQNFEDIMLWRALKHINNGCYVDVGAQHPVIDSVSRLFYEKGWRGMHIEPVPQYAKLLRQDRPDETVLQLAISNTEGMMDLTVIADTGLSTAVSAYARSYNKQGRDYAYKRISVRTMTLEAALAPLAGREVHWLKVDVEGLEEKVLQGWDSRKVRPWILVVEATIPGTEQVSFASWDAIITGADYRFVYFDGLNRFYVAREHEELAHAFSCPPNIFDNFRLSGLASSELCQGLLSLLQEKDKELAAAKHLVLEAKYYMALRKIVLLPLRAIRWVLRLFKRAFRRIVVVAMRKVLANPYMREIGFKMLDKIPKIKHHLRMLSRNSDVSSRSPKGKRISLRAPPRAFAHFLLNISRTHAPRLYYIMARSKRIRALYQQIIAQPQSVAPGPASKSAASLELVSNTRAFASGADEQVDMHAAFMHAVKAWPLGRRVG